MITDHIETALVPFAWLNRCTAFYLNHGIVYSEPKSIAPKLIKPMIPTASCRTQTSSIGNAEATISPLADFQEQK
jgi:hypothetical protein